MTAVAISDIFGQILIKRMYHFVGIPMVRDTTDPTVTCKIDVDQTVRKIIEIIQSTDPEKKFPRVEKDPKAMMVAMLKTILMSHNEIACGLQAWMLKLSSFMTKGASTLKIMNQVLILDRQIQPFRELNRNLKNQKFSL